MRYKNSFLGYLWALANPFAFALVYYTAFKIIMRVQINNYSIFLLTALFPWVCFSNSIAQATGSFRNNALLVKKVKLIRGILPLGNVVHEAVHFCFAVPILCSFIYFTGCDIHLSWIWQLPIMLFLQIIITYPLALMLAIANVYVRDVEYLVSIMLSLLFFLTPIAYSADMAPETYRFYFKISPLAALVENWRSIFLNGEINYLLFGYCLIIALVFSVLALLVYKKSIKKLGELL